MVWCVKSLDRVDGKIVGERWCVMARKVYGKHPEYRNGEFTKCCDSYITLPCGYEDREPTCDGGKDGRD